MTTPPSNSTKFFTRNGPDVVDENGQRLRWFSFDVPTLHQLDGPSWKLPTAWEQRDAVSAVAQLGGRVLRTGPLSIRQATDLASIPRNGTLLKSLDGRAVR
jgi:hypothetical protein